MITQYIAPEIKQMLELHPYLAEPRFRKLPVLDQISLQAQTLHNAHRSGDTRIGIHVMSWWPNASGMELEDILKGQFSLADATLTMSSEALAKLIEGALDPTLAFMTGKLKVAGSMAAALKLAAMLED